jgi:hypothetical protein
MLANCLAPVSAMVGLMAAVATASPDALFVRGRLRADIVILEAFYLSNLPACDAVVSVQDVSGREIAVGRTDDNGEWSFPRPSAGKYVVVADVAGGHLRSDRTTITIPSEVVLKTMSPAPDEIVVTGGPTREELTRFPWLRVVIGVATITGLVVLLWFATRSRRRPTMPHI